MRYECKSKIDRKLIAFLRIFLVRVMPVRAVMGHLSYAGLFSRYLPAKSFADIGFANR